MTEAEQLENIEVLKAYWREHSTDRISWKPCGKLAL